MFIPLKTNAGSYSLCVVFLGIWAQQDSPSVNVGARGKADMTTHECKEQNKSPTKRFGPRGPVDLQQLFAPIGR